MVSRLANRQVDLDLRARSEVETDLGRKTHRARRSRSTLLLVTAHRSWRQDSMVKVEVKVSAVGQVSNQTVE